MICFRVKIIFFSIVFFSVISNTLYAVENRAMEKNGVLIFFSDKLKGAADEVAELYPGIKADVEQALGLKQECRTIVLLTTDRNSFQRGTGGKNVVAYAVPRRSMIVIDYTKMKGNPFTINTTLKHEFCHLLLHYHLKGNLPKWLDEGIAQIVSDSITEIIVEQKRGTLNEAVLSNNTIPLSDLTVEFPNNEQSLFLAYKESKSFVEYIRGNYGKEAVQNILGYLKAGESIEAAVQNSCAVSLRELEQNWLRSHKRWGIWLSYLSNNLYLILFFTAGLITIVGFIRLWFKKRAYKDEEPEEN